MSESCEIGLFYIVSFVNEPHLCMISRLRKEMVKITTRVKIWYRSYEEWICTGCIGTLMFSRLTGMEDCGLNCDHHPHSQNTNIRSLSITVPFSVLAVLFSWEAYICISCSRKKFHLNYFSALVVFHWLHPLGSFNFSLPDIFEW